MKDNTFIGLLEFQLELIKSADEKDANSAILNSMKDEIGNLEKEIKQASKQKEKLTDELTKLQTEYEPIAEELAKKETEFTEFGEAIVSYITDHYSSLKLLIEKHFKRRQGKI